jgi:MFS family permease
MVVQAFFMDAQEPNIDAIALEHLGEDRMFDYGRIRGWSSLTYASGCLLFGAILQRFGIRWAMPLYGISALLVLAWTTTIVRDRPRGLERHGRLGSLGRSSVTRPGSGGSSWRRSSCGPGSTPPGTSSDRGSRIRRRAVPDRAGDGPGRRRRGPRDA